MKPYFLSPLTTLSQCEGFFSCLINDDLMFHPEDDPSIVVNKSGDMLFSDSEVNALRQRINEVYRLMDDPCDFILTLIHN
jgi:hypothetical protein